MNDIITVETSANFTAHLKKELIDTMEGRNVSLKWLLKEIKKQENWKRLTKQRKEKAILLAYYLGRNNLKPEPISPFNLLPKVKQ